MTAKPIAAPAGLKSSPIGPLPRGLSGWLARVADRASNSSDKKRMPFPEALDAAFDEIGLSIVDLHSDTLLWGVDPWRRRAGGHVDIPRLLDARVGLQVFGGPTWTPLPIKNTERALCVSCNSIDQSDALFPSQWLDRMRRTKGSLRRRRAYRLAERFHELIARDRDNRLRPIYRADDLEGLREATPRRGANKPAGPLGVMLSLEGVHWIEPETPASEVRDEIAMLRSAGFRMIAPTHRFSNGLGGASEDCAGRFGLTRAGRAYLAACFEFGVAVDLAHAAPAVIREAAGLALSREGGPRPLIVSHAGVRGAHRVERNLRDADIRAVASTGGVVGVGVWQEAIGFEATDPYETKLARVADAFAATLSALRHPDFVEEMQDRYGRYDPYEHIAIGSDFDGAVTTPFDVTGLGWLLLALAERREEGSDAPMFPVDKLRLVAGENALRALRSALATG